jgi:predicted dehydrogenase
MVEEQFGKLAKYMNILIVGLGSIGQRHLRNLKKIDSKIKIYAYRRTFNTPTLDNQNNVIKENLEKKYNLTYIKNLENLEKYNLDAGIICSPSSFHVKESIKLLKQRINIFVEKPLGSNLSNIKNLEKILKTYKKINMMGYQLKFCPIINTMKNIIKKKKLGNIKYISIHHGEHIKNFHRYEKYINLYASKKKLGGGVVLTQIHEIDYLLYILGEYFVTKIKSLTKRISNLKIDVEDTLAASLELKNKKNNKIFCNLHLNYYEIPRKREINIIFEKGRVSANLVNKKLIIETEKNKITKKFNYPKNDLFLKEMKFFIKHVKNNLQINKNYSVLNGIKSLKLALKLKN